MVTSLLCCLALQAPALAAVPQPDEAAIRERLDDIYSRPAFRRRKDDSPDWLQRQLKAFLEWLGSLRAGAPFLFWLLLVLCGVALGALVALVIARVRRAFFVADAARQQAAVHAERRQLSRAYEEEAGRRAERGEFTEAIRFLFLALVYRFDESGRILFRTSFTNREYLNLFADRPTMAEELRVFVDALDDHWYGQRPTGEQEYRDCRAHFEALRTQGG